MCYPIHFFQLAPSNLQPINMRNLGLTLLLTLLIGLVGNAAIAGNEKMIFAVDIIRHGDRSPIDEIPAAPYKWPQGLGQLSPLGMRQEYQLGEGLHHQYVDQYHLLPPEYLAETMFVQSSDIDRTLMSAECALMGMYPPGQGPNDKDKPALPGQYQPIPIHTKPKEQDSRLIPESNSKLHDLIIKFVDNSTVWKEYTEKVSPQFAHWSSVSGLKITNLHQVAKLADAIEIYQLNHVPLPAAMTSADISAITEAGDWAYPQTLRPFEVGSCAGAELLSTVAGYFDQASKSQTNLKFVLFSAHDSTIGSVMSALNDPLDHRPPYASDLNIALFQEGLDFKVKIMLNGRPVAIPEGKNGTCSLAQFKTLVIGLSSR